jgi:hypothetical protein
MTAASKAKVRRRCQSRLFFADGRVWLMDSESAYVIWLAGPGTALRVEGDRRPVQAWEYFVT